jgi:hypothetical protein
MKPGEFIYWEIAPQQTVSESRKLLFTDSINRLMSILIEDVDPSHNFVFELLAKGLCEAQIKERKGKERNDLTMM